MTVSIEKDGEIAVVTVDNPPVNAAGYDVRKGLVDAAREIAADDAVKAVALVCAGRTFIAGADIREFNKPPREPHLTDTILEIANSPKPWVAAIHGAALGGGLEVALGCHYRIADAKAKMGLPEVNIGVLPGAGGTQRLPRMIGVKEAAEIITSGKPIGAKKAAEIGLVAKIVEGDLRNAAIAFAREIADKAAPRAPEEPAAALPEADWAALEAEVKRKAKGQISPVRALEITKLATEIPLSEGLRIERRTFMELRDTDQARALRHAFFAERAVSKLPELEGVAPRTVESAGVVGGGLMGGGIAICLLRAGLPVTLIERDEPAVESAIHRIREILEGQVKRGRMTADQRDAQMARLAGSTDYDRLASVDIAIEAVFEKLDVKQEVFRALDAAMKPGAVLATNTSYMSPAEIGAVTRRPDSVLGMHFFSPAHIMRLVEVIPTPDTAADVLATGFDLSRKLGKVAVKAGICDGFIGNRILQAYQRQASYLLEDGCLPHEIDAAIRGFGLPMGLYEMADMAGLDIGYNNRKRLEPTRDPRQRYSEIADRIVELGRLGQKSGAGFYRYEEGARKPIRDPEIETLIVEHARAKGIERRSFSADDIMRRILAAMINEGALILEEGIAARPLDIDMVELYGYGFPRWRGGLMWHADEIGMERLREDVRLIAGENPGSWTVSRLIEGPDAPAKFADLNG